MGRKAVERNISYDNIRDMYYVNFDYGKDENGKRIKVTKTYKLLKEAKKALTAFEADKDKGNVVAFKSQTYPFEAS